MLLAPSRLLPASAQWRPHAQVRRPYCVTVSEFAAGPSLFAARQAASVTGAVGIAAAVMSCSAVFHVRRHGLRPRASRRRSDGVVLRCSGAAEAEVQADFVSACSMANTWEEAVEDVAQAAGSGYDTGFAFISERYVDQAQGLAPVMETLRERLGVEHLVGGVCSGALGQAAGREAIDYGGGGNGGDWPPIESEEGFVLSIGLMKNAGAVPFFIGKDASGDVELVNRMAQGGEVRSLLLLGDPFGPIDQIMRSLDETFPKAVKAGGITAALQVGQTDRGSFTPAMSICSKGSKARLLSEGISGLMLTEMDVHTVVCQGCRAVGPPVRISDVAGPVCTGIGGKPAKESVMMIFGAVDVQTRQQMQEGLMIGLGRMGEHEAYIGDGDWLIRAISEVTPNGGLVLGHGIEEGQPMRFHVRDRSSAEGDLDLMLNRYRLERSFSGGGEPVGCFMFTCNGRGEGLYGQRHVDSRALPKALGDAVGSRVSGFFCNGEIGAPGLALPISDESENVRDCSIHGFTAVYAMLVPRKR